jgi:hypothetical protein
VKNGIWHFWWVERPSPRDSEGIAKQTWTHVATSNNVIPQVFQSQRNLPRRPKPESYGWNHISRLHGLTLQLQPHVENWWKMCLQWRMQENVCRIQSNLQDMQSALCCWGGIDPVKSFEDSMFLEVWDNPALVIFLCPWDLTGEASCWGPSDPEQIISQQGLGINLYHDDAMVARTFVDC